MATAIQFLRSSIASLRPSPPSLSDGMPMVNFNASDPGLYFKLNDQSLMKIGPTSIGEFAPNYNATGYEVLSKGEMWLDTTLTETKPRPVLKLWDGTTWEPAGGSVTAAELPQPKATVLAGPVTDPDQVPTFRAIEDSDLPDSIEPSRLGGNDDGALLIGGEVGGFAEAQLSTGDDSLTVTTGENKLTIEVTAGNIAGKGADGTIKTGDGHVQLNYDGLYSADNRFKFLTDTGTLTSYGPTELGQNPLVDTHTIIGATSISGDVELTNVYGLTVGGDLFVGHNAQIGSDTNELLKVYNKSEFYSDVFIKDSKTVDIDGYLTVQRSTVLGTTDTDTLTINATTTIPAGVTIGRNCTQETFTVKSNSVFECDVSVSGELTTTGDAEFPSDVILGTDCSNFVAIQGTQLNKCDIYIGSNVPNANAEQVKIEAATGDITTKGKAKIVKELIVSDPIADDNFTVDGATGNVLTSGTITTTSGFIGDGSQLFNLAVPNVVFFMGEIDATTASAPVSANAGDFYLNTVTGTVSVGWPDIAGAAINQDQFIYYSQDGVGSFKWGLGSVQNNQGFVTINTDQTIAGSKTFTAPAQFTSTVDVTGAAAFNSTVTVQGATQLNDALTVANNKATLLGGTLEVLGASTIRDALTVENATALSTTLSVGGASALSSTLSVTGPTSLNELTTILPAKDCSKQALVVNGLSTFECLATFSGGIDMGPNSGIDVGGDLNVDGNATLGTSCASSTLTVKAVTSIECATSITNTLGVTGNVTLGADLSVTGAASISSTLAVTGTTTLNSTLTVQGNTTLNSSLTVAADKNTSLGGTLTVANGKATALSGTLGVTGMITASGGITGALTGNATTATTLQNARNINGTSFNGSADITTATWGTARTLTIGNSGKSVNGSGDVAWTLSEIGAAPSSTVSASDGQINFNSGTGLTQSGSNATANQSGNTTKTFSIDRAVVDTWYAAAGGPGPNDGQINFNASTGLSQSGTNATANQSGNTTKSFSINRAVVDGWYAPSSTVSASNGAINVNSGNGLQATGNNATANQSGATTRTLSVKHTDSSIASATTGIKVSINSLPTR